MAPSNLPSRHSAGRNEEGRPGGEERARGQSGWRDLVQGQLARLEEAQLAQGQGTYEERLQLQ